MNVLEKKDMKHIDGDVYKYLSYFELPGMGLNPKGSNIYENPKYKSDYEVIINIPRTTPAANVFNMLRDVLLKIEKDHNVYFVELKLQTKSDTKERFHHDDVFTCTEFEKNYAVLKFFKVDIVFVVKNRFFQASCIYTLTEGENLPLDTVVKAIKKDIEEYKAEGFYYKVLKRYFSIYALYQNTGQIEFLMRVFNSDLGKLYELICNLEAIEELHQYYKDDKTKDIIAKNLRLIREHTNLKSITANIQK